MYRREFCHWTYAGAGCYETGLAQPTGFVEGPMVLFAGEIDGSETFPLYNGQVSSWDEVPRASAAFNPVPLPQLTKANGTLVIDLKASHPSLFSLTNTQLEIGSGGGPDVEEWAVGATEIIALGITNAWQTFEIPFSTMYQVGAPIDVASGINWIRFYSTSTGIPMTLFWRNAAVKFTAGEVSVAEAKFSLIDCKGLTKANGQMIVDLKCDFPARIGANSQIEVTSSGQQDTNEWAFSDLSGNVGTNLAGAPIAITTGWQTHYIDLDTWVTTGDELDVEAINFVRAYAHSTGGSLSLDIRNVRMAWPDVQDDNGDYDWCSKTLRHCRWHGNAARFGGFPGIPTRRTERE